MMSFVTPLSSPNFFMAYLSQCTISSRSRRGGDLIGHLPAFVIPPDASALHHEIA
jgi:hypothetical protein